MIKGIYGFKPSTSAFVLDVKPSQYIQKVTNNFLWCEIEEGEGGRVDLCLSYNLKNNFYDMIWILRNNNILF